MVSSDPKTKRPPARRSCCLAVLAGGTLLVLLGGLATASLCWMTPRILGLRRNSCAAAATLVSELDRPVLDDKNGVQIPTARALGLAAPLADRSALEGQLPQLPDGRSLQRLEQDETLRIATLTHSVPYLTPDAVALVQEVGARFQRRLAAHGLPSYRITISSALRTQADQEALRQKNGNASARSAHFYGTTVDFSYGQWERPLPPQLLWLLGRLGLADRFADCHQPALRPLLRAVLAELRAEGAAWVLEERQQRCFHTTVRRQLALER